MQRTMQGILIYPLAGYVYVGEEGVAGQTGQLIIPRSYQLSQ